MEVAIWTLTTLKPSGASADLYLSERDAELARIKVTIGTVGDRLTAIQILDAGDRDAYDRFMREHADSSLAAKIEYRALEVPTPAERMCVEYDTSEGWGEHPTYSMVEWQDEVAGEGTRLGYWDWVLHRLEQADDEANDPAEDD